MLSRRRRMLVDERFQPLRIDSGFEDHGLVRLQVRHQDLQLFAFSAGVYIGAFTRAVRIVAHHRMPSAFERVSHDFVELSIRGTNQMLIIEDRRLHVPDAHVADIYHQTCNRHEKTMVVAHVVWLTISSNSSRAKAEWAASTRSATSRTLLFFMIALRRFLVLILVLVFVLVLVLMDVHIGHAELAAQFAK